jgi:hypothetical protein
MISLELDKKEIMNHLLLQTTFDHFLLVEGAVTTFSTFHIDGTLMNDFLDSDEKDALHGRTYGLWQDYKPFFLSVIKGKRTPLGFKFVFTMSPGQIRKFIQTEGISLSPDDVQGLYMNLIFDGQNLNCITGTSMKIFTLDKSLEQAWDQKIQAFYKAIS